MTGEHYLEHTHTLSHTHSYACTYRLAKEKIMYEKEVVDQEAKIEKMKAENKDEYDIKKQARCIYPKVCIYAVSDKTVLSSRLKFSKNLRIWSQTAKED